MEIIFDAYTRRARLSPALITALPLGILTFLWVPQDAAHWGTLWGLVAWSGGTLLIAEFGRFWGRELEPKLFAEWGGRPTTILLRHRGATNRALVERRHAVLQEVLGLTLPGFEEEERDRTQADSMYETAVTALREHTRDRKRFPLVFDENCNYGFRRNLLGLRPIGLAVSIGGLIGAVLHGALRQFSVTDALVILILAILVLMWISWITKNWARTAAFAYAEKLLSATELMKAHN